MKKLKKVEMEKLKRNVDLKRTGTKKVKENVDPDRRAVFLGPPAMEGQVLSSDLIYSQQQ